MPLTEQQATFVRRYIGGADVESDAAPSGKPLDLWNAAREEADIAMARLQAALKSSGDPALQRIAEFGLNGVSEGNQVALVKRLFDYQSSAGEGRRKAASSLVAEISKYREMLASNRLIALCEKNPFGIDAPIRRPLAGALDKIERIVTAT